MELLNLNLFSFEIYLVAALVFFLVSSLLNRSARWNQNAALIVGLGAVLLAIKGLSSNGVTFGGSFEAAYFTQVIKLIFAIGFLFIVFLSRDVTGTLEKERSEYFLFLISSTLGMSLLISSTNLLTFFVSLELASYSLYVLVPMRRGDKLVSEASFKYFLMGSVASGLMLYGLSFLYGATGSLDFETIFTLDTLSKNEPLLGMGLILASTGLLFKLAVIPFHFWAPDVYEKTPAPVTCFIATLSKLAGVAVLLKFYLFTKGQWEPLNHFLIILSLITMTWGNLAALRQNNAKRMLAYSSISQVGYLLLGVLAAGQAGFESVLLYMMFYLIMNFGAFLVISTLSTPEKDPTIEDFKGLSKRAPLLAFLFLLSVFSLAGIPPLAGFTGKWILFKSSFDAGYSVLVFWAMINSTISLFYYLTFVKASYVDSDGTPASPLSVNRGTNIIGLILCIAIILLGVVPGPLYSLARQATIALF